MPRDANSKRQRHAITQTTVNPITLPTRIMLQSLHAHSSHAADSFVPLQLSLSVEPLPQSIDSVDICSGCVSFLSRPLEFLSPFL